MYNLPHGRIDKVWMSGLCFSCWDTVYNPVIKSLEIRHDISTSVRRFHQFSFRCILFSLFLASIGLLKGSHCNLMITNHLFIRLCLILRNHDLVNHDRIFPLKCQKRSNLSVLNYLNSREILVAFGSTVVVRWIKYSLQIYG